MRFIGPYRVMGLLGRGGMGSVYKVRHIDGGSIRALKLLRPNQLLIKLMSSEEIRRRFEAEAKAMARISHPNVVSVLQADLEREEPFYVMEHFCNNLGMLIGEGYDLEAPSRAIEPHLALDFIGQALSGLEALHVAGIVHRDFKPFNVMLGELDEVKLSDLGLSRLRGEIRPGPPNLRIGSPYYAAPEQEADPNRVDCQADLYSAAVTLFRLVTGRLPSGSAASKLNPNLDPQWELFFAKGLHADPSRRFSGAEEMGRAVGGLAKTWQDRMSNQCGVLRQWRVLPSEPYRLQKLRTEPRKISLNNARGALGLDDLWRPRTNNTVLEQTPEALVVDKRLGLVWQQGGSGSVMTWPQAHKYIEELNARSWLGFRDWRLPTTTEAVSLLRAPQSAQDLCLDQIFDPAQIRIWTCDRCAYTSAWLVCFDGGYLGRQDLECHNFVRAVCSYGS